MTLLRGFQQDLANRVLAAQARGARIIAVQAATGSGKTTITSYLTKLAAQEGKHVLSIVHRRRLVDQISQRLTDFGVPHGVFMNGSERSPARVQVASRDTITARCLQGPIVVLPHADLVIIDEAHHAHSQSEYRRILDHYPKTVILLVTATPVWPDGSSFGPWAQALECSPPVSELIRDGFLAPVRVFAPVAAKEGLAGNLVASWRQFGFGMPTVLFTSRVAQSKTAVASFEREGIPAAHIDADTTGDERDRIYDGLETGKVKVVSNCGCITEGVDLPCVGCVQIARSAPGRVAFLQMAGRSMRPHRNKRFASVIVHSPKILTVQDGQVSLKHGFPDEDQKWSLNGDVDAEFVKRQKRGHTLKARFCQECQLVYHGGWECPECGRDVRTAPPLSFTHETIAEAARDGGYSYAVKVTNWINCLNAVVRYNGTFGYACEFYHSIYQEWPLQTFPFCPDKSTMQVRVRDVYPPRIPLPTETTNAQP